MEKKYRNSQKRIYEDGFVYFVTSKTKDSFPFFQEEIFCDLWIEELKLCKELKKFELYAFCLLPNHFHLLLKPNDKNNISEIMRSLKTNFSRNINRVISREKIHLPRKARSRDLAFVVHEQCLQKLQIQFHKKYENSFPFSEFKWQSSFHDHIIRNEKDLENHFNYTTYNFQKHGLPDNWKYTSLRFENLIDTF